MKNTRCCIKCNSNDTLKIPGKSGAYGTGNNIQMGSTIFGAVLVSRYVCCNCGYSEERIDNKSDIEKLKKKY